MRTYREQQPDEHAMTTRQLLESKYATEISAVDRHPRHKIWGRWYCINDECHVRLVTIDATWEDGDRPPMPEFRCPSCRKPLAFQEHLRQVTLLPLEDEQP